ncbi:MAG: hypothetical protein AABX84_03115, partial [Nanoarchaeota archaeon]
MDKSIVETLINELSRHAPFSSIEKGMFLDVLLNLDVPESSKFYQDIPENEQLLNDGGRYHYLSLRRVLRNRNAANYQLSRTKKLWEMGMSMLKVYNSNVLTRRARIDGNIVDLMTRCIFPFSLLGKFDTYEPNEPDKPLLHIRRPVLVIPGLNE